MDSSRIGHALKPEESDVKIPVVCGMSAAFSALFAPACAVSYMLSGYIGLYTEQEIVYSKLKPVVNDRKNRNLP